MRLAFIHNKTQNSLLEYTPEEVKEKILNSFSGKVSIIFRPLVKKFFSDAWDEVMIELKKESIKIP